MTTSLEALHRCRLAVDLGTSRTRVHVRGAGIVVDEPTVAAVNMRTGGLMAVGAVAERMVGRTPPHIQVIHPVGGGSITHPGIARRMLRYLLGDHLPRRRPFRAAVCTPYGSNELEQRAAIETLTGLGARRVELLEAPVAAAVGCRLPVQEAAASMVVVCGAAVTDVVIFSLGGVVAARSVRMAGDALAQAVARHAQTDHSVWLPARSIRQILSDLRTAEGSQEEIQAWGRDMATGMPRCVGLSPKEVNTALEAPVNAIVEAISVVLHDCPPELSGDLLDRGIVLTGGTALIRGLEERLSEATGLCVHVPERPLTCTVEGLGALTEGAVAQQHTAAVA
ncbi:rod shape-determining protein [Streptomyces sp. NPDC059506]|uniref:rod shape-determining protein n=1 Tax=Streptomyces TaxID=1883 RepID=UPI000CBCD514|nr:MULTISPECIES: rod shape-determining protein [unclassified Streptomyces]MCZ2523506.1 rod shape-determining protein [Streptomyces sp. HB2AG]PLW72532.1 rod shape-determining protein [Streptomyces sp. DJ]QMV20578.1 rod shape-determining protein MreB [Streptomyces sp. SCUT-3]